MRIARRDSSSNVFYYLVDNLDSSRVIAEVPSGQTTPTMCYDADFEPYGGEHAYLNSCPQNYKFTSKERDTESGLDNFGARYYASTTGRFMSPDWALRPIAVPYAVFGDPQTLNLYTYVENSPLNRIDADGHYGSGGLGAQSGDACPGLTCDQDAGGGRLMDQTFGSMMMGDAPTKDGTPAQFDAPQAQNNGVQGQIAANPPQLDSKGNPTFNPPAPAPPSMGEPAHVGQTGVQTTPTGAVVFTYQVYDRNWNAICCVSVKENVQVLPSTSANSPPVISNHKFVFAMDGKFSDTVGPNFRPAANANFRTETRQSFTAMTDSGTFRLSTTIRQSTVVTNGQVVVNANPIVQ